MREAHATADLGDPFELVEARVEPGRRIPLLGTIAAGTPLPAFQVLESIDVPGGSWRRREVFALRVCGTSMVDDGILDGDYLVVEPGTDIHDGQTVVAEVDGHATVKRFYRERDGAIRLQPANERLLPLVLRGDRVLIRGIVVGVLRKQGFRAPSSAQSPGRRSAPSQGAADLAVRILEQHVVEGNRLVSRAETLEGRRRQELKALAQSLRALHATYVETSHPRLRKALLEEATRVMRQLRAIAQRTR
ncbi:MAG: repressor LexA [Deltaproteobacteria bacterium]|nr:repressor LexA [Deltaproteobacteria bacterium]